MDTSLICTVYNEERNIESFIQSIIKQTKRPNEFIIVDGKSTDNTYNLLKKMAGKHNWIKVHQEKGNISKGRNIAIRKAKYEIILVCDAGGIYDKQWIENLTRGFNGQVSFGMDRPLIKNKFQEALAKEILHKNVPGSSRNMIFLKKIWKEVGGYPEDMERSEDTLFDERIKQKGHVISRVPDAICHWEMRSNLREVEKQFYGYGYWDGVLQRRYRLLPKKYLFLLFILMLMIPLYPLWWALSRLTIRLKIKFAKRFSYLFGFLRGYFR